MPSRNLSSLCLGREQKPKSKEVAGLASSERCEDSLFPTSPLTWGDLLVVFHVSWLIEELPESLFSSSHVQGIL